MKFKSLFEDTSEDVEYWRSMPHEHLHAETHGVFMKHGYTQHKKAAWLHPRAEGNPANYHAQALVRDIMDGKTDEHGRQLVHSDLEKLGWQHQRHMPGYVYAHPNYSVLTRHSAETGHWEMNW